jgi:hypothetical protein
VSRLPAHLAHLVSENAPFIPSTNHNQQIAPAAETTALPVFLPSQTSKFAVFLPTIDSKPPHGFSPFGHVAFAPVQTAYKPSAVFTIHHSPFTLHHSLFTIHSSPFTLHHSLFTIHSSPFTLHHS